MCSFDHLLVIFVLLTAMSLLQVNFIVLRISEGKLSLV